MTRPIRHRYLDPLDQIWLATAAAVGLRVRRSDEVYAATEGRVLAVGDRAALDPDDCLAQMIFHELCHSLVEGEESFDRADWGLDSTSDRDLPRERACLMLQAHLAGRFGLRRLLAPTTEHRRYYDALPEDPLSPRRDPASAAAQIGARRADKPPWAPHLARALAATGTIARQAASFSDGGSLFLLVDPAPEAHPLGGVVHPAAPERRCGRCAWRGEDGACRQRDARAEETWPGCERFEPAPLDCSACGACCRAAYHSVEVDPDDPVRRLHPALIIDRGSYLELARRGDRCAALTGELADGFSCSIYADRPRPCREFEIGGEHCLTARRRVGASF